MLALTGLAAAGAAALPASAEARGAVRTTAPVYTWWDGQEVVGTSTLIRTRNGITARIRTTGIPQGNVVTLWAMFFNAPEECSADPCVVPADMFDPDTEADFHFLSGHVVGGGPTATFAGHLRVGTTDASGKAELPASMGAVAVPLTDPAGAEVIIALHDHGPAATGSTLRAQLSSFLGGCETFNGPDGFASGPGDIPDDDGECSTFQRSLHQ